MRCARAGGLAHHAGGSCRVLERVDGDVYVLPARRRFFAGRGGGKAQNINTGSV